ncbi:MAG: hypothetical protein WBC74_03485 [Candidatus Omnitrophota bacterium]
MKRKSITALVIILLCAGGISFVSIKFSLWDKLKLRFASSENKPVIEQQSSPQSSNITGDKNDIDIYHLTYIDNRTLYIEGKNPVTGNVVKLNVSSEDTGILSTEGVAELLRNFANQLEKEPNQK